MIYCDTITRMMDSVNNRLISIAPMIDVTDRHCRTLLRLLSQHMLLFTEMITAQAIKHGDKDKLLAFDLSQKPLALQLGGSEPDLMAECAALAETYQYDEVNINVGCPSDRVQAGRFGACLMKEPELVADMVRAMRCATSLPVTVKCRIGVDDGDSVADLKNFIEIVAQAGCTVFYIHARKAWLNGLSPKENRNVPPLVYDRVYEIKRDYPDLQIIMNGGIQSLDAIHAHLKWVDGCMIGRAAIDNMYMLAGIDQVFFGDKSPINSRLEILKAYCIYMEAQLQQGTPLYSMVRHLMGLCQGVAGARAWRRRLSALAPGQSGNKNEPELLAGLQDLILAL